MVRTGRLSRRTVLRGMGAAIALPWLEAMAPITARARGPEARLPIPRRAAFLYVPNGVHTPDWTPAKTGDGFTFTPILRALGAIPGRLARALRAVAE